MNEFARILSDILDAQPGLRAMIVRPVPRPNPHVPFGQDLLALQVIVCRSYLYFLPPCFLFSYSPLLMPWIQTIHVSEFCPTILLSRQCWV